MPYDAIEELVIKALAKLTKGGEAAAVSADTIVAELSTTGIPREAVIRAIWRLADLDEIDFREGRRLAIGDKARLKHASAA